METVLLWIIVVLGASLVVLAAVFVNVARGLKASLVRLESRVQGLQADLSAQQANLDAVRAVLERKPDDPFAELFETVRGIRSRGLLPTVAFVGFKLFRSYLTGRKRQKALPSMKEKRSDE
ncbi:MAG: hypothetical protein JST30_01045 [Armatimonadetes bacterium]|nr:hypothetical protein [Armatimonadota bacterium]